MSDTPALLVAVAEFGEFFALPPADDGPWQPIGTLLADATTVRDYALRTQAAMAAAFGLEVSRVPLKAAASSFHLSIAARVLSPVIAAAVTHSAVPMLTAESLRWQADSSHRPKLGVAQTNSLKTSEPADAAQAIGTTAIDQVLGPLGDTMRRAVALSPQVLWGNVASASHGAVKVLGSSRPHDLDRGHALVRALLALPALDGTADYLPTGFKRHNCCLYYQVPSGGYCGDCVLS